MNESNLFELVTLVDALKIFRQHAWRYKGLLIANYSGVAASMNRLHYRDSGKPFEYIEPFSRLGFVMQYANSDLSNQAVPYFIMDERCSWSLSRTTAYILSALKRAMTVIPFRFSILAALRRSPAGWKLARQWPEPPEQTRTSQTRQSSCAGRLLRSASAGRRNNCTILGSCCGCGMKF